MEISIRCYAHTRFIKSTSTYCHLIPIRLFYGLICLIIYIFACIRLIELKRVNIIIVVRWSSVKYVVAQCTRHRKLVFGGKRRAYLIGIPDAII